MENSENEKLDQSKIKLISENMPEIETLMQQVKWKFHKQEIKLQIFENKNCDVLKWIFNIDRKSKNTKKCLIGAEKEDIILDICENKAPKFEFSGIDLKSHKCIFSKNKNTPTIHKITLSYDSFQELSKNCRN